MTHYDSFPSEEYFDRFRPIPQVFRKLKKVIDKLRYGMKPSCLGFNSETIPSGLHAINAPFLMASACSPRSNVATNRSAATYYTFLLVLHNWNWMLSMGIPLKTYQYFIFVGESETSRRWNVSIALFDDFHMLIARDARLCHTCDIELYQP